MVSPVLLFMYRLAVIGYEVHAKCISCSPDSPDTWEQPGGWMCVVLPDGPMLDVKQVLHEEVARGYPIGGDAAYSEEPFLRSSPRAVRDKLFIMQNYTYIKFINNAYALQLPCFMTVSSFSVPAVYEAEVSMLIAGVDDLPDVRLYLEANEAYSLSSKATKWDALMFNKAGGSHSFQIPVGCYLPGTIESNDGRETGVVYEIRDYFSDNLARMKIYAADSAVMSASGSILTRRARSTSGQIESRDIARLLTVGEGR